MLNLVLKMSRSMALLTLVMMLVIFAGGLQSARAAEWSKVNIVYTGDVNGKIEPCG
jgi:hypothetical protein